MGLLCVTGLGFVPIGRLRQVGPAETLGDQFTQLVESLTRHVDRVSTHVGDQPHAAAFDVYAFVQLLGDLHSFAGAETEFTRGLLLQRGGGKWRSRIALFRLFFDRVNLQVSTCRLLKTLPDRLGLVS